MVEIFLRLNKIIMLVLLLNKDILMKGCGIVAAPQRSEGTADSPNPS
jgi:hypothetical protein